MELLRRILPLGLLVYLESEDSVPKDDIDRLNVRDNLKMAMEADNRESNAVLLAAGKGIQTAKVAAVKTAEIVTEKTYVYTEQARKIAEKHMDLALTHWRQRMGDKGWTPSINWVRSDNREEPNSHPDLSYVGHEITLYFSPTTGPAWLSKNQAPIVLRKRREHVKSTANWPLFYYHFSKDHSKSNLIWNYKTREELREALESEIAAFKQVYGKE